MPKSATIEDIERIRDFFKGEEETHVGRKHSSGARLDVGKYLTFHEIAYTIKEHPAGDLYLLDHCLFDQSHTHGESAIIQQEGGMLLYHCYHDSCKGHEWREARKIISGDDSLKSFMSDQAEEGTQEPEDQGAAKGKIQFVSAADLCNEPKFVKWLIGKYIEEGSLGMTFGEPEAMKTFNALDQGLSVATGHEWHKHAVQQGPVFYLAGEGHAGLSRRIQAYAIHYKVDLKGVPFFVSDQPAQFLDAQSALDVTQAVDALRKEHGKPVLVIIDTLNRNFGPGDENATHDMTKFIATIDKTIRVRYGCAVLLVHHSGLNEKGRARGASALRAALDFEYKLQKNTDSTRTLTCTKCKDHEPPPAMHFRPEIVNLEGWSDPDTGGTMTSCVLLRTEEVASETKTGAKPLTGARQVALDALISCGEEFVHIDTWRKAAYDSGISPSASIDTKKKAFQRAVTWLQDKDYVTANEDYWSLKRDISGHFSSYRNYKDNAQEGH